MPGENENFHIGYHGLKEAQGFVTPVDHAFPPNDISRAGICGAPLNPDPHGAGPKTSPYMPRDRTPLRGDPASMAPPHNQAPHREAAATERMSVLVTPRTLP